MKFYVCKDIGLLATRIFMVKRGCTKNYQSRKRAVWEVTTTGVREASGECEIAKRDAKRAIVEALDNLYRKLGMRSAEEEMLYASMTEIECT